MINKYQCRFYRFSVNVSKFMFFNDAIIVNVLILLLLYLLTSSVIVTYKLPL